MEIPVDKKEAVKILEKMTKVADHKYGNVLYGKMCYNGDTVPIDKASINSDNFHPKKSLDLNDTKTYFHSLDKPNSWLQFDFITRKVRPTHYSIRSRVYGKDYNLQHWDIEGSNDGVNWTQLDSRRNETCLDNSSAYNTFVIKSSQAFYRYLRR